MTEYQIQELCKFLIENGNRKLTKEEKEVLKKAVDESHNVNELMQVAVAGLVIDAKNQAG